MAQSNNISQSYFYDLSDKLIAKLGSDQYLTMNLSGEDTHYCRMNNAKVRQTGTVSDFDVSLNLVTKDSKGKLRQANKTFNLCLDADRDLESGFALLASLQKETDSLPEDLFAVIPTSDATSEFSKQGKLLDPKDAPDTILSQAGGQDLTGIYSSGALIRANATSAGAKHWFATDSFLVDYSMYGPEERAYKGFYGGSDFDVAAFNSELERGKAQLAALAKPIRTIERGEYRTYLAPAAVAEFSHMLFGCFSESAIQQGDSPLRLMREGEVNFSEKFNFADDFSGGYTPRFSSDGELFAERMALVEAGAMKTSLISKRTAKEYNLKANGASPSEYVQSPVIGTGTLNEADAVKELGKGLYISNLHYLNWSDRNKGRITGMTRYACFWVENGELVAPIENLRWDDTLFRVFGSELEAFTTNASVFPDSSSYEKRGVGAMTVPGAMLKSMAFTL